MRFGRAWLAGLLATGAALLLAVPAPASEGPDPSVLAGASVRSPIAADRFYFVMTDRYRNGDPSNDTGGASGGVQATGFDPSSDAYYHGGDLAGLTGNCNVDDPGDEAAEEDRQHGAAEREDEGVRQAREEAPVAGKLPVIVECEVAEAALRRRREDRALQKEPQRRDDEQGEQRADDNDAGMPAAALPRRREGWRDHRDAGISKLPRQWRSSCFSGPRDVILKSSRRAAIGRF